MAGLSLEGGRGRGRRSVDTELNMIPMIDLFMVTISFLLLTAVWSAGKNLPSTDTPQGMGSEASKARVLDLNARDLVDIVLAWKDGPTVIDSRHVTRDALGASLATSWKSFGQHFAPDDPARDRVVLHVRNDAKFDDVAHVLDVLANPIRDRGKGPRAPAFIATLATD